MLVARAFVLSINGRAGIAILLVSLSVAYAVLTSAAAGGIGNASESVTNPELAKLTTMFAAPALAPFPRSLAPAGSTVLVSAERNGTAFGTIVPWPYGEEIVPQPYAPAPRDPPAALPVGPERASVAPWTWVLLPPGEFDRAFPQSAASATILLANGTAAIPGLVRYDAPNAIAFYTEGAAQVGASVHLVVAAMGASVAILAAGVLYLEVLARERDLATLESLGGRRVAQRAVVLRAVTLSGVGVVLGLASGVALAFVAGKAVGGLAFRVDPWIAAEAAAVSFLAGALAGSISGLARMRAPLAERLGRRGAAIRPFRGPIRFLLVTPRVFPAALIAAIVLASISGVVLAAASIPYAVFEPGPEVQVLGRSTSNPFHGSADRFLGEHATLLKGVNGSSPESLAPTIVLGKPVVVRGLHIDAWQSVDNVTLVSGRWPTARGEALVGVRAERVLGLHAGDRVVVPGAYRASLQVLSIVGTHEAPGLFDDEIVTDLDTVGDLAALSHDKVNMIRVKAEPGAVSSALSGTLLVALDMHLVPERPVPNTYALAHLDLLNLGGANASRALDVHIDGVLAGSGVAHAGPREATSIEIPFLVPSKPGFRVSVNPTLDAQTTPSEIRVIAPERIANDSRFDVLVQTLDGAPIANASVVAGAERAQTDASGKASFHARAEGEIPVTVSADGRDGGAIVYVVDPAYAFQPRPRGIIASVVSTSIPDREHVDYALAVTIVNVGGAPFDGLVNATSGNATVASTPVVLGIEESATVPILAHLPAGARNVTVAGLAIDLPAVGASVPREQRPLTLEDVLQERRDEAQTQRDAQQLRAQDLIKDVFAGLQPSVAVVVLATFVQASAGVSLAVLREMREREEIRGTLHDVGATEDQIALRAVRDSLSSILPGLLLGAILTYVAFSYLGTIGFPAAFGHTIPATQGFGFYARVVGGLALVATLTAFWTAYRQRERRARQAPNVRIDDIMGDP